MSSFQHTAEPWTVSEMTHTTPEHRATILVGEFPVSVTADGMMPPEEFKANVQLMAASATLLATLREIEHTCWEEQRNPNSLGALASIRQSAHNATETARPI